MEAGFERAYWKSLDEKARNVLDDIRRFIHYLENVKRELCLASARLSSDEAVEYIGPATEVALAGIGHALDYLAACRCRVQENDLMLTTRALIRLDELSV